MHIVYIWWIDVNIAVQQNLASLVLSFQWTAQFMRKFQEILHCKNQQKFFSSAKCEFLAALVPTFGGFVLTKNEKQLNDIAAYSYLRETKHF